MLGLLYGTCGFHFSNFNSLRDRESRATVEFFQFRISLGEERVSLSLVFILLSRRAVSASDAEAERKGEGGDERAEECE